MFFMFFLISRFFTFFMFFPVFLVFLVYFIFLLNADLRRRPYHIFFERDVDPPTQIRHCTAKCPPRKLLHIEKKCVLVWKQPHSMERDKLKEGIRNAHAETDKQMKMRNGQQQKRNAEAGSCRLTNIERPRVTTTRKTQQGTTTKKN